ncbi:hypothetical protein Ndes2526B_g00757 [Nannochloris sp. 'desiccata']
MPRKKAPSRIERVINRICNPHDVSISWTIAAILLIFEALLCLVIIAKVPYTEIDWIAYMDEVSGYDKGERDYINLKGDTGPLVYPAGFVYLFSWLRSITHGAILPAQYIFAALYLATQFIVMALYITSCTMPPWSLVLLCLSRRLHSIFVLRLFNDCWAMCIAYVATWALQKRKFPLSIFLFSLAVSVKMNVLLFAPGVLAVVIKEARVGDALRGVIAGIILQGLLGLPFLTTYPKSYLLRAFEFSRVFTFKWSVNWQFLPEDVFTSQKFALLLLFLHLRLLWSFAQYHWFKEEGGILPAFTQFFKRGSGDEKRRNTTAAAAAASLEYKDTVLKILFTSNFVGIMCARSLHYQFYSWYFHALPFLLLRTRLPAYVSVILLLSIEVMMNIFPPREWTSALFIVLHGIILWSVWASPAPAPKVARTVIFARNLKDKAAIA